MLLPNDQFDLDTHKFSQKMLLYLLHALQANEIYQQISRALFNTLRFDFKTQFDLENSQKNKKVAVIATHAMGK